MGLPSDSRSVRLLRRSDLAGLATLRRRSFGARVEPTTAALVENDELVAYVAESSVATADDDSPRPLVGYTLGRRAVWPPIWRTQRVGEIVETYVDPGAHAPELLASLITAVTADLSFRGVEVLRAKVAWGDRGTRTRFEAIGFTPLMRTFIRTVDQAAPSDVPIAIRPARASDVPSLVLLSLSMLEENGRHDSRLTPHPDAAASLAERHVREVGDPRHVVLVAEEKPGLLVGFAAGQLGCGDALRSRHRDATITACFVVPLRRRRGIARLLADRAAEALILRGADELRLHVVAKNASSLEFWSSLGYEPVEELLDRPIAVG